MTHYSVPKANRRFAKSMRKVMTNAELKLWNELRAHRLMGLAFRRQMPIAGYIVDFACPAKKLVVEVDGSQHGDDTTAVSDAKRTGELEALGWTIIRFLERRHPPRYRQCLPAHRHPGGFERT